jgi:hypothetical protein
MKEEKVPLLCQLTDPAVDRPECARHLLSRVATSHAVSLVRRTGEAVPMKGFHTHAHFLSDTTGGQSPVNIVTWQAEHLWSIRPVRSL